LADFQSDRLGHLALVRERRKVRDKFRLIMLSAPTPHLNPLPFWRGEAAQAVQITK